MNDNRTSDDQEGEEDEDEEAEEEEEGDEQEEDFLGEYEDGENVAYGDYPSGGRADDDDVIEETIREHLAQQQTQMGDGGDGGGMPSNGYNTMNYIDVEKLIKSLGNDEKKIEKLKKKLSLYIRNRQTTSANNATNHHRPSAANFSFEQSTMADATDNGNLMRIMKQKIN